MKAPTKKPGESISPGFLMLIHKNNLFFSEFNPGALVQIKVFFENDFLYEPTPRLFPAGMRLNSRYN
jgi:hypothetical protein